MCRGCNTALVQAPRIGLSDQVAGLIIYTSPPTRLFGVAATPPAVFVPPPSFLRDVLPNDTLTHIHSFLHRPHQARSGSDSTQLCSNSKAWPLLRLLARPGWRASRHSKAPTIAPTDLRAYSPLTHIHPYPHMHTHRSQCTIPRRWGIPVADTCDCLIHKAGPSRGGTNSAISGGHKYYMHGPRVLYKLDWSRCVCILAFYQLLCTPHYLLFVMFHRPSRTSTGHSLSTPFYCTRIKTGSP